MPFRDIDKSLRDITDAIAMIETFTAGVYPPDLRLTNCVAADFGLQRRDAELLKSWNLP